MSIYDNRDKPAYGLFKTEPNYAKNPYILKWWNSTLDELLATQISLRQWVWYWGITDQIVKHASSETIEIWKKSDPLCSKYAWYNILMYFSIARAEQLGLTRSIRHPKKKTCPLCENNFIEDSLPIPLVQRLGIDRLDFCAPCLRDTVLQGTGNDSASEKDMLKYLQDLANLLGRVPTQNFGEGMADLLEMKNDERLALLVLLKNKPTVNRIKSEFGSWLNALIHAGILEDGTRKTSRGIQSIAKDGHVCLSLGEKTIDDYLHTHGVHHEKEPRYPESNYRGDFKVGTAFIEYFGLTGNPEYDAKTKEKIRLCEKHNIVLIALYPRDLISQDIVERKLSVFFQEGRVSE
ncbi:MAG: homing endonuclease associated repeat-containing protein [Bellilinea sp.]